MPLFFLPQLQYDLAGMYINGLGVKQNDQEGFNFKWLKKAAEQDDVDAQFKVGMMYREGRA